MTDPTDSGATVRAHLIESLCADIVGPFAGPDAHDAPEILDLPPSRWYLAGFLAPETGRLIDDPTEDNEDGADTAVVVHELFTRATREVWIAAYRFDHGAQLLAPLHQGMATRGVQVRLFAHIQRGDHDLRPAATLLQSFRDRFFRHEWPWAAPRPAVYHDPRTLEIGAVHEGASLHAKCVVVDGEHTLIGSANFTDRAHTRNVEAGALISDRRFAARLID